MTTGGIDLERGEGKKQGSNCRTGKHHGGISPCTVCIEGRESEGKLCLVGRLVLVKPPSQSDRIDTGRAKIRMQSNANGHTDRALLPMALRVSADLAGATGIFIGNFRVCLQSLVWNEHVGQMIFLCDTFCFTSAS